MKVILSHDVDHLFITEHWKDRFIPGLIVRSTKSFLKGNLTWKGVVRRFSFRLHRIPELVEFNNRNDAPSSFFFGMANGSGLSYKYNKAAPLIQSLYKEGHFIGIHGIAYNDKTAMLVEKKRLVAILGDEVLGIRNHYLRQSNDTQRFMSELEYRFDSTDHGIFNVFEKDGILSIPISVMDVEVIKNYNSAKAALKSTFDILNEAERERIKYFVINFHDLYFDPISYPVFYQWYTELVKECKRRGYKFTDFKSVIHEQKS